MTPDQFLDVDNYVKKLKEITSQNDGCLFLMATNPTVGVLPDHFALIAKVGNSTEIAHLLINAAEQKPDFKTTLKKVAELLPKDLQLTKKTEKEILLEDLATLGQMRQRFPEISQTLRMLQNHVKEKIGNKSLKTA